MLKASKFVLTFYIIIAVVCISIILAIIIYSPYYSGFEAELNYLSPDLSENRTVIRDSVNLTKESKIKIVFEKKYNSIKYDKELFSGFITNLELEIWNDDEYYYFQDRDLIFFDQSELVVEIPIGTVKGNGNYFIYINSDYAVNPAYHIGIGIGRETRFKPFGNNRRNFY